MNKMIIFKSKCLSHSKISNKRKIKSNPSSTEDSFETNLFASHGINRFDFKPSCVELTEKESEKIQKNVTEAIRGGLHRLGVEHRYLVLYNIQLIYVHV